LQTVVLYHIQECGVMYKVKHYVNNLALRMLYHS